MYKCLLVFHPGSYLETLAETGIATLAEIILEGKEFATAVEESHKKGQKKR